jgi:hypothetical protein
MVYSYLFPICYLEHSDSLSLRHAKRLMSWVRSYAYRDYTNAAKNLSINYVIIENSRKFQFIFFRIY